MFELVDVNAPAMNSSARHLSCCTLPVVHSLLPEHCLKLAALTAAS
jgi:hypothetical protein